MVSQTRRLNLILIFKILFLFFIITQYANSQTVEVMADSFFADEIKRISILNGNVVVKNGDYDTLTSDKIVINFDDKKQPLKYTASGNAKFKALVNQKHYDGKANEIVYDPTTQIYTLTGNAYLHEQETKKEVFGYKIILNQSKGTYEVKSDKKSNQPARLIFQIEDKK